MTTQFQHVFHDLRNFYTRISENLYTEFSFLKKPGYRNHLRKIKKILTEKIFPEMNHNGFCCQRGYALIIDGIVLISMGKVGPYQDQITIGKILLMISHCSLAGTLDNKNQFKLRVIMPGSGIVRINILL